MVVELIPKSNEQTRCKHIAVFRTVKACRIHIDDGQPAVQITHQAYRVKGLEIVRVSYNALETVCILVLLLCHCIPVVSDLE